MERPHKCNLCKDAFVNERGLICHKIIDHTRRNYKFESNNKRKLSSYTDQFVLSKKEKIDKTLFTPKIVSGILLPTLPKSFRPIPDYECKNDYNHKANYDQSNLIMLANVITNLEKL